MSDSRSKKLLELKAQLANYSSDEDEEEEKKPIKKENKDGKSKVKPKKTASTKDLEEENAKLREQLKRMSMKKKKGNSSDEESDEESDDESSEEEKRPKPKKKVEKGRKKHVDPSSSDEDIPSSSEEEAKKSRPKKGKNSSRGKTAERNTKADSTSDIEEDSDSSEEDMREQKSKKKQKKYRKKTYSSESEDDSSSEDERYSSKSKGKDVKKKEKSSDTAKELEYAKKLEELHRLEAEEVKTRVDSSTIKGGKEELKKLEQQLARITAESIARTKAAETKLAEQEKYLFGLDVCFIMDCTGSMSHFIQAAKTKVVEIVCEARKLDQRIIPRIAFVGYTDFDVSEDTRFNIVPFTEGDQSDFALKLSSCHARGGGDGPEDVAGGFTKALGLDWKSSTRLAIHIADAPCHGRKYHNMADDYDNDYDIENLLGKFCDKKIDFYFAEITSTTRKMTDIFKRLMSERQKELVVFPMNSQATNFLPGVVNSIKASVKASVAFRK